ncbi:hypothetical protein IBL26_24545 [Roseomonas aerophila]|uniref:Uncharacterized protein n=1 Tax=Teichococcus aerophilus TaxID=1224513 RepID=A0ABR7RUR0_9PROT|nr:hypothetical protein [Pseudoroseomonas aerophila]MBC9210023.1 hypothetical protein [Pseudoroseomonas aerophila]
MLRRKACHSATQADADIPVIQIIVPDHSSRPNDPDGRRHNPAEQDGTEIPVDAVGKKAVVLLPVWHNSEGRLKPRPPSVELLTCGDRFSRKY